MTAKQFILLLGALVIGLSLSRGVRAADEFGCRVAYRPPQADYWFGHFLYGCRDQDTLVPTTAVYPVGPSLLEALWGLRRMMLTNSRADPISTPTSVAATFCDRMHLWAEDEGKRAPAMTRDQKIRQACGW